MDAPLQFSPTGNRLIAGKLAGGGLLAAPGSFFRQFRKHRTAANNTPTFHYPEWPRCGCPDGTMRPECPGLKARIGAK